MAELLMSSINKYTEFKLSVFMLNFSTAIVQCQISMDSLSEAITQLEFLKELQPTIGKSAVSYC